VDLQAPGVTMPVLGPLFGLSAGTGDFWSGFLSQKSLFLSLSTFGMMVGALLGGRLADFIGRKWVAVTSVILFGLLSALTAHATSGGMLLWCRFLTGVGLGGATPTLIAILAETCPPARRSTAIGCFYAAMPVGGALVSLSSYLFLNAQQWGLIYYIGAAIPILSAPGLWLFVPHLKPVQASGTPKPNIGFALFGAGRALRTVVLWLAFFFGMITMYILLGWLPSLLIGKGLSRPDASIVQIGFNVLGAVGGVLTGMLIDKSGRGLTVGAVFVAAIVALAALAGAPAALGISVIMGSLVGFTVTGAQVILYALAPTCYPTEVRGTGVGFAIAVGRIGSATGPLLVGALLSRGLQPVQVLGVMAPAMLASGIGAMIVTSLARRVHVPAQNLATP
jgi:AAHS family 3-hydroxyphenylpropionic acid transporter